MTRRECACEVEVLEAVAAQRWPARVEASLAAHVAGCEVCADVVEVATALHDYDGALREAVHVPSAESVWFRAQARARAEASRQAARPIAVMQAIGLAAATGVISLLIGVVALWVWQRADWLTDLVVWQPLGADTMSVAVRGVLLAIGLWLLLAPVAVYLVASDD